MKNKIYFIVMLSIIAMTTGFSQQKKPLVKENSIFMTWNKNTPEQEMKDDVKALGEHGVTITYSNVKRNSKEEITAIKVEYADENGGKGAMELDNQKPINTIKFFKQGDEVGFGEPSNSDSIADNFTNGQNFMKQFNLGNEDEKSHNYNFAFPNDGGFGKSSSKIFIQNDGKKLLVIEDGKVVEGGDDYNADELEKIKKENKVESFGNSDMSKLNFNFGSQNGSIGDLNDQIKKMQEQLDQLMPKPDKITPNNNEGETKKSKEEILKAKDEMMKAKEEIEKTTEELKKTNSSFKTQKA